MDWYVLLVDPRTVLKFIKFVIMNNGVEDSYNRNQGVIKDKPVSLLDKERSVRNKILNNVQ
jgi:hypothetical protein